MIRSPKYVYRLCDYKPKLKSFCHTLSPWCGTLGGEMQQAFAEAESVENAGKESTILINAKFSREQENVATTSCVRCETR